MTPLVRRGLLYLVTAGALLPIGTRAGEPEQLVRSHFGFSATISPRWLQISPESFARSNAKASAESLGISDAVDRSMLDKVLASVKAGKIEYFFFKPTFGTDAQLNVSVQVFPRTYEMTVGIEDELCSEAIAALPEAYGKGTKVLGCGRKEMNGVAYFALAYSSPSGFGETIQYEIPFGTDSTLTIVGGGYESKEDRELTFELMNALAAGATTRRRTQ